MVPEGGMGYKTLFEYLSSAAGRQRCVSICFLLLCFCFNKAYACPRSLPSRPYPSVGAVMVVYNILKPCTLPFKSRGGSDHVPVVLGR